MRRGSQGRYDVRDHLVPIVSVSQLVTSVCQTIRVNTPNSNDAAETHSPKPFLRWAGGKRQLVSTLLSVFPANFKIGNNHYFEPFIGGGAVVMALRGSRFWSVPGSGQSVHINDINDELVCTYQVLKDRPKELISALKRMSADISEARFYEVRRQKPRSDLQKAARFIYLNRLCFNGLHRVNSRGEFNVPYGKLTNPTICNEALLLKVSDLLQSAQITHGGFVDAVKDAKKGDLVYFDPPYVPLSSTSSFSKYARSDFGEGEQRLLAATIDDLVGRGVYVVLSNSSAPLARHIFQDSLNLFEVKANRSISASGASRNKVNEVLGISYEPTECADQNIAKVLIRYKRLSTTK